MFVIQELHTHIKQSMILMFVIQELHTHIKQSMIDKKIWQTDCPVKLEQLRLLIVNHYDFRGEIQEGNLVIHEVMAENAKEIFKELFELKFPIAQIKLIDVYNGDDELSMADNNSSCFNYRKISGSDQLSVHSYGLAIDVNPLQNPFIVIDKENYSVKVYPKEGINYLNRHNRRPGMVEPIVEVFKKYGFDVWGGSWNDPVDYHHFQAQRKI